MHGKDHEEHDRNLKLVLDLARQVDLKLNLAKCKFGVTRVNYVAHIFTSDGLKPDPEKVTAVTDMPHLILYNHYSVILEW